MGGPSAHGQKNKAHKSGRSAGKSARDKQKLGKEGAPVRVSVKASTAHVSKLERLRASQQFRDAKRQELLDKRRKGGPPVVVAILPLSDGVDTALLWSAITAACDRFGQRPAGDACGDEEMRAVQEPQGMLTLSVAGRARLRITLLPPPTDRQDLLAIVELGKAADMLLLAMAGGEGLAVLDSEGEAALGVLRALGMPGVLGVVQGGEAGRRDMKERAAAKKRAEKALTAQISGEVKVMHVDNEEDCTALVRHLAEHSPVAPLWRQQRPSLLAEAADFVPSAEQPGVGTLRLCGYVRHAGLSANRLLLLPGAGDFQIAAIEGPQDPHVPNHLRRGKGGVVEVEMGGDAGEVPLLAVPNPEEREAVVRENQAEAMANEQTWPTDEELQDADVFHRSRQRRRVPAGTSEYQAAWILDDEDDEGGDSGDEGADGQGDAQMREDGMDADDAEPPQLASADALDDDDDFDARTTATATDGALAMEEEEMGDADRLRQEFEAMKRKRHAEADDGTFPDEVDTPVDVPARVRFQRYRGLASFRTSPWDPKEGLPAHYARVFAFENFKRAHRRAREATKRATEGLDPCAVPPGTYVRVSVAGVSVEQAAQLVARVAASLQGNAPPLLAFGLLQNESRLSVLNFAVRKAATYQETVANKEELLFVTGLRTFPATPIFSTDDLNANKHKMERFLRAGQHCMASVIAPISYPPLPLLAFKILPGQPPRLAAFGSLRSCEPDRVVVKKIILSGYPMRVHKRKATIRFMFHSPEDIRWFQKLELWTKSGRRGRIVEPLGTHGAMKCTFDGAITQQDSVCVSLYKRAFAKWPADLTFA